MGLGHLGLRGNVPDEGFCPLEDSEANIEAVRGCRSTLDSEVWVCVPTEITSDISSLLSPGRIRAVKRFAEREFSEGEPILWVRLDEDTWEMRFA